MVETVRFGPDLSEVIVTARMNKEVERTWAKTAGFGWCGILGFGGVSGLETVVSGTYIEVEFGDGNPARTFAA